MIFYLGFIIFYSFFLLCVVQFNFCNFITKILNRQFNEVNFFGKFYYN